MEKKNQSGKPELKGKRSVDPLWPLPDRLRQAGVFSNVLCELIKVPSMSIGSNDDIKQVAEYWNLSIRIKLSCKPPK